MDLDNIRAAIGWALEHDDPAEERLALRILASVSETLRLDPAMGLGALAVEALSAADSAPAELRSPVMTLAAYHEWSQGHTARALELVNDALRDGVVVGSLLPHAAYTGAVSFEMAAGNHARSLQLAEEARAQLELVDSAYSQAHLIASIASFEAMAGRFEQARVDADRAFELAQESENVSMTAAAYQARIWVLRGDDPAAALRGRRGFHRHLPQVRRRLRRDEQRVRDRGRPSLTPRGRCRCIGVSP